MSSDAALREPSQRRTPASEPPASSSESPAEAPRAAGPRAVRWIGHLFGWLRDAWLILGIALLMWLTVEGVLALGAFLWGAAFGPEGPPPHPRAEADVYQDKLHARRYFAEFERAGDVDWKPYVYWRRKPFRGEFIQIDERGIRRSVYPDPSGADLYPPPAEEPLDIWMFGGSTMWGDGAADAGTIPSLLGAELAAKGIRAKVVNFGEIAYVSAQGALTLILELREGRVPDIALFYDGVNDTYSVEHRGEAGIPMNEEHRIVELGVASTEGYSALTRLFAVNTASAIRENSRVAGSVAGLLEAAGALPKPNWEHAYPYQKRMRLAADAVGKYRFQIETLDRLGEDFGFRTLFYWQPSVYSKPSLTPYERGFIWEHDREMFDAIGDVLEAQREELLALDFHNLRGIFADAKEPLFIDSCHLSEIGNAIIARRMAEDVLRLVAERREGVLAAALTNRQRYIDGWHIPETGLRWSAKETFRLRFDRPLDGGDYIIELSGYNPPYSTDPAPVAVRVVGESFEERSDWPAGAFGRALSVRLTRRHDPLILEIERPLWIPKNHQPGSVDDRLLGLMISGARVSGAR
jgi:lysophospholipase L1-like esterase